MASEVYIVSAKRTAIGHFLGKLSTVQSCQLGSAVIKAICEEIKCDQHLNEVFMGCVLPAGLGQAPARQAAIYGGIPNSVPATTLNKVCGSGMQAIILGMRSILAGEASCILAGGMESMSNAPYLLTQARLGYRMGTQKILDHMLLDGLEDAYHPGKSMGEFAEMCAEKFNISRAAQDQFAIESYEKAKAAQEKGYFFNEIVPISVKNKKEDFIFSQDEGIEKFFPDKLPKLKPAFKSDGTITAANASSISDGAAALILMNEDLLKKTGAKPLAKIIAASSFAQDSSEFTTAPIFAIEKLLAKTGWDKNSVDLYEINEAFAVVVLAAMQALKLPREKINIHGGACVLGHPIGASGARIVATLTHALMTHQLKRGIATACIGGGEATAIAIERV